MKFDVDCVRETLLSTGEVFTVRKWKSKDKYKVTEFEGRSYLVELVKTVRGIKSIRGFVHKSGFDNVDDWWTAIKKFGASRGHLYHVTLMEDEGEFSSGDRAEFPKLEELLEMELEDCDRFMNTMSHEKYANGRLFYQSNDEQGA